MHRDINPRHILIVDSDADPCKAHSIGVLHDFHHVASVSGGVGRLASFERDRDDDSDYVRSFQRFVHSQVCSWAGIHSSVFSTV